MFALILFLGVFVYKNSLWAEFHYDDFPAIVDNPFIKHINFPSIWQFDPSRFLTNLTFAINYFLNSLNVVGWHIVNILIHCVNAALIFRLTSITLTTPLIKGTLSDRDQWYVSLSAALLFLLHPIQTQAVIYVVQRATLLATLFYLWGIILYARARMTHKTSIYLGTIFVGLLGMLTKPLFMTLPVTLLVYDICFLGGGHRIKNIHGFLLPFVQCLLLFLCFYWVWIN